MKTILVPTDFSENSANACKVAMEFGRRLKAKITLFHSYVVPVLADESSMAVLEDDQQIRKEAESRLNKLTHKLKADFPEVNMENILSEGYAEDEIILAAKNTNADIVIMGTQGASGLKEVLVGSITGAVMEEISCPILAVPEQASFKGVSKIVFATNYADGDYKNAVLLADLARQFNAELILLHVSNGEMDTAFEFDAIEKYKEKIVELTDYKNIIFKLLESRNFIDGLSFYLDEIKADLFSMSMPQRNFFQKIFNRSKTKRMAFHTHIPLLAFHSS